MVEPTALQPLMTSQKRHFFRTQYSIRMQQEFTISDDGDNHEHGRRRCGYGQVSHGI
jgi:hypothetical protein